MTPKAHETRFGAELQEDGVCFRLWAPDPHYVDLLLEGRPPVRMQDRTNGWREAYVAGCKAGDSYAFKLPSGLVVPDPASRWQPNGVFAPSKVVDPSTYQWADKDWAGRPWCETVLYETHIGAATPEGTFAAFSNQLERLADLGVTAIELMPLAECPGARTWGYDGVLLFAPNSAYGSPDDLKALIDRAHSLGLMVLIDVVYNHFGPSGNYLNSYASSFFTQRHDTPWGAAINFDDRRCEAVRLFFVQNALYWIQEFHADGLRLDAVHAIKDESEKHILAEISEEASTRLPDRHVHLVLENDLNEAHWLVRRDDGLTPRYYAAQWNDDAHHVWHVLLTGEVDGYYGDFAESPAQKLARSLAEGFVYQGELSAFRRGEPRGEASARLHPIAFVDFLQNHDQIGNRAFGERLDAIADDSRIAVARAVLLLCPHIPMLFMGEEWGSRTPFRYFVDFSHDAALSDAVRQGRRQEFETFAQFANLDTSTIPDPTSHETFIESCLSPDDVSGERETRTIGLIRQLLAIRRTDIWPMLKGDFHGAQYAVDHHAQLTIEWTFAAGRLRTLINLSDKPMRYNLSKGEREIYRQPQSVTETTAATLTPWSVVVTKVMTDDE